MAKAVPIEIFNIARTQVDRDEVRRWLTAVGVSEEYELPDDGAVSNPALLVALAARRCYRSFEVNPQLNPNVTQIRKDWGEYLDNVLKVGHGCYDAETEVLTAEGWKSWPDVGDADPLATLSPNGRIEYRQPVRVIRGHHTGRMYRVEASGVDLLVTPDHRMFVCPTTTKRGRTREWSEYQLVAADNLGTKSCAYLKSGVWNPRIDPSRPYLSEDELRFVGFSIGDGYCDKSSGHQVRFRLRRERKIVWLTNLVQRLGWAMTVNDDRIAVNAEPVIGLLRQMYTPDGEKQIPQARTILTTHSKSSLEGLLEGLMQSDGSAGRTGDSFDTTSQVLAGQFQQLCLHVGLAANYGYTYGPEKRPSSYGDKPLTRLHVVRRNLKPEVNKWDGQVGKSSWIDGWDGDVFCAEMPADTARVVYVRRNGQPVWCGNSVLEHSVFTFALEGVSRVFTAEMNRHRAGWAISEGSLRFIRFSDAVPYWEPDSIQGPAVFADVKAERALAWLEQDRPSPTAVDDAFTEDHKKHLTRVILARSFDRQRDEYATLERLWATELGPDSKFKKKKELTSLFRRIVGMGCATGGVWSGNVRALRHVITMRCEPAAEEEILHVFSRVAKLMRDQEPLLFGDFSQDEAGYWRPQYRKV